MIGNKKKKNLVDKVEVAIDAWKKENPDGIVMIEVPGQSVSVKLSDANIYVDGSGVLVFDAE